MLRCRNACRQAQTRRFCPCRYAILLLPCACRCRCRPKIEMAPRRRAFRHAAATRAQVRLPARTRPQVPRCAQCWVPYQNIVRLRAFGQRNAAMFACAIGVPASFAFCRRAAVGLPPLMPPMARIAEAAFRASAVPARRGSCVASSAGFRARLSAPGNGLRCEVGFGYMRCACGVERRVSQCMVWLQRERR